MYFLLMGRGLNIYIFSLLSPQILAIKELLVTPYAQSAGPPGGVNAEPRGLLWVSRMASYST